MIAVYCNEGQHHFCSISGCTCACHDEYRPKMRWDEWNAANPRRGGFPAPAGCVYGQCEKPARARGMCDTHYTAWRRARTGA